MCLDSQSVRLAPRIYEQRGMDGGKRVNGRKRRILTDVQGRILSCRVQAANGRERRGRFFYHRLTRAAEDALLLVVAGVQAAAG